MYHNNTKIFHNNTENKNEMKGEVACCSTIIKFNSLWKWEFNHIERGKVGLKIY